MASSPPSSPLWTLQQQKTVTLVLYIATLLSLISSSAGCPYTTIFSFGDSITDTGNLCFGSPSPPSRSCLAPYGETYFRHPTGRYSNGRLIIDFIAESLGIPFVKPYQGIKNGDVRNWTKEGVNFAVSGATALNELLPSICTSSSSCKKVFEKSLFLVGEIGVNDFKLLFSWGRSLAEIKTHVRHLINAISSTVRDLIDVGAQTLAVPGNYPLGCGAAYLTWFESNNKNDYDEYGCLKWLNHFVEYFNQRLQAEINNLQELHPHAKIIYFDYYNAALPLYHFPTKFGFTGLKACCGGGGAYNFNFSKVCGDEGVKTCENPSKYISWDGVHLTQAANKLIARDLLKRILHCSS
ncbi:hypothetical protein K1719_026052 [Acacia pycnantha]|nr:hypothetical protein K1719_026052 [Acacia pycnantha]